MSDELIDPKPNSQERARLVAMDQKYLSEAFSYDPENGTLIWKRRPINHFADSMRAGQWNTKYAGREAGSIDGSGYKMVRIAGGAFACHRLIWILVHGHLPASLIDHINGIRSDNRLINLREADYAQNGANSKRPTNNKTGHRGISKRRERWRSQIRHCGVIHHLGYFSTIEEAIEARRVREIELFGEYSPVSRPDTPEGDSQCQIV
jgi:hypothetical protein